MYTLTLFRKVRKMKLDWLIFIFLLALSVILLQQFKNGIYHHFKTCEKICSGKDESKNFKIKANKESNLEQIVKNFSMMNVDLFKSLLQAKSQNGTIYMASADYSYIDMALNLYEASIKRLNITNFLFVCSHPMASQELSRNNITSVTLWNDTKYIGPSEYKTEGFGMKNIYKTIAITIALKMGITVLILDVDIVLFKHPGPYLICQDCDMIFQNETVRNVNGGFYLSFPTKKSIKLHTSLIMKKKCWKLRQQVCLNRLLRQLSISVKRLDTKLFLNGYNYFDIGNRMFATDNPCTICVSLHNNFIRSLSSKIYRFKEQLLWVVDKEGYYSNKNAKYLVYDNLLFHGEKETMQLELNALANAFLIGHFLNRTVILPKFFCYLLRKNISHTPMCAAHVHFKMQDLDNNLKFNYREHMFLQHPKVPSTVKKSISDTIFLNLAHTVSLFNRTIAHGKTFLKFVPISQVQSISTEDFIHLMKPFLKFSVIKFHSLYGEVFHKISDSNFTKKLHIALRSRHKLHK